MSIRIFLDNYNNVYFPGQTISGRIECIFNNQKNFRAIRVKFRGICKTAWTKSESYYDHHRHRTRYRFVNYFAKEAYVNSEYNLVQGGDSFSLPAGKYIYPFSYILPPQLPSSFEGTVGHIRYCVKAVVDRPWKFDYKANATFTVAPHFDLNLMPNLREPVALSDDKTMFSCCCNDSGALTFNLTLPMTGYVPGQDINIGCFVQNLTNVSVESVHFSVVATTTYITKHPHKDTKSSSCEIGNCVERGIGAHGEKSWTSTLRIATNRKYPNLIPCSIINLRYTLEAKVVLPSPHLDMKLQIPITIGSVALLAGNTTIPGPPSHYTQFDLPNNGTFARNSDLPGYSAAPCAPIKEIICLPSSETASAIRVKFRGTCETAWTKSEYYFDHYLKRSQMRVVNYFAKEAYVNSEYNLVQGGDSFSLPAGKYIYPFSYILPPQLPSTFEGSVGHVRYCVKAVVDRPWKFDYKTTEAFTVAPHFDLNSMPDLREPVALSDDKTMFSCCCNDSGALTFNLTLPMSGYVPGQDINIGCHIKNLTNVSVKSVQFSIVLTTTFITNHPYTDAKSSSCEIGNCVESGIGAHGEKSWTSTLRIATNRSYPNLIPCGIINLRYTLEAKVVLPPPHSNMTLEIPITIGTVALLDGNTAIPGPSPYTQFDLPNMGTPGWNSNLPGYPAAPCAPTKELPFLPSSETASAPPPSYEELKTEEKK